MDPRNYLTLILRRWKEVVAFGLIFLIISASFSLFFAETEYKSTLFFTVAGGKGTVSLYEDTRGADLFSETVQGWTKNPGLIEEIEQITNESFGISGRVQESQNVVIELSANSETAIKEVSEETLSVLRDKVKQFNEETGQNFSLAIPTIKYVTTEPGFGKNELIFLVMGLLFGIGFVFLYEYLADKASFEHQIEEVLKEKIAGRGREIQKLLMEKLEEHETLNMGSKLRQIPSGKENLILLIRPGKTRLKDLEYTRANSRAKIYPIIIK